MAAEALVREGRASRGFHYTAPDGLRLHARVHPGARGRPPIVCLPGLTRNARDFDALAQALSREAGPRPMIVAFDYRGRGLSQHDRDWRNYDVRVEAADVVAGLTALGIEHGVFIGTSRGGLIIHLLAAMRPGLMKGVVLNDFGPRLEGAGLAQIRAYLERAPKPKDMTEAVLIQKTANAQAFPALGDADWERLVRAQYVEADGAPVPAYDPALFKTLASIDFSNPLPEFWPQFAGLAQIPVLAIRGANSKLLSAATLAEMERRHPDIETVTVEGQGHAPLLETAGLPARIAAFLDRLERVSAI
jgi:pimeloyl-ACP methyl ester carboxylesterase